MLDNGAASQLSSRRGRSSVDVMQSRPGGLDALGRLDADHSSVGNSIESCRPSVAIPSAIDEIVLCSYIRSRPMRGIDAILQLQLRSSTTLPCLAARAAATILFTFVID